MPKARTMSFSDKKYTPVMCQRLVDLLANGGTRAQFCRQEDIAPKTFDRWLQNYEEFRRSYEKAKVFKKAFAELKVEQDINMEAKNQIAYKAYLYHVLGLRESKEPNINIDAEKITDEMKAEIDQWREKWEREY